MKITIESRGQTPSHTDVAVFVNGANAGVLTLRNEEVAPFLAFLDGERLVDEEYLVHHLEQGRPACGRPCPNDDVLTSSWDEVNCPACLERKP